MSVAHAAPCHRLVRGSNNRGKECYSSCYQAKQHQPDAASGVYCITVGGDETNRLDLYCDMETMGGGWTYVARGSNSDDGCDTDAFGTVSADHFLNSRWSLGNWAINEIGYDQGTKWLEYYVTVGHNSDNGYAPHDKFRLARVPLGSNFTLGSGMDVDYDVEVRPTNTLFNSLRCLFNQQNGPEIFFVVTCCADRCGMAGGGLPWKRDVRAPIADRVGSRVIKIGVVRTTKAACCWIALKLA